MVLSLSPPFYQTPANRTWHIFHRAFSRLPQGLWWISGRPYDQIRPSWHPTSRTRSLMHRSGQKKWGHRASLRSTSCSGKTTVPSGGSTSNSSACANRASSGQQEAVWDPCITRVQWGGMPRPWRPTAASSRRQMKVATTLPLGTGPSKPNPTTQVCRAS